MTILLPLLKYTFPNSNSLIKYNMYSYCSRISHYKFYHHHHLQVFLNRTCIHWLPICTWINQSAFHKMCNNGFTNPSSIERSQALTRYEAFRAKYIPTPFLSQNSQHCPVPFKADKNYKPDNKSFLVKLI